MVSIGPGYSVMDPVKFGKGCLPQMLHFCGHLTSTPKDLPTKHV